MSLRLQDEMSPEQLAAARHAEFAGKNAKPSDLSRANAVAAAGQQDQGGSVDQYIDHVLQMSGMIPTPTQRPNPNAATPLPHPGQNMTGQGDAGGVDGDGPDAETVSDNHIEAADNSGMPLGQIAAALAGGTGLALLGKYIMRKYMSGDTTGLPVAAAKTARLSPIDETIAAIDGEQPKQIAAPQKQLPAPMKQLEAPRKLLTDQSGQNTQSTPSQPPAATDPSQLTDDQIDDVFRNRVEGSDGARPATQSRFNTGADPQRAQIIDQASKMPVKDAAAFLQSNGIPLDDNLLQQLVEQSGTANAIRSTVRRAVP